MLENDLFRNDCRTLIQYNNAMNLTQSETRFDRSSRLLLLFALIFIALDFAQLTYRFSLPTEGWAVNSDSNDPGEYNFYVLKNVVGADSQLQPGDALRVIGGVPSAQILNNDSLKITAPPGWQKGEQLPVTVIRDKQTLNFRIPIVSWTMAAWLRNNFDTWGGIVNFLSALIMLSVGFLVLFKRPGNLAARFLFLFGVAVFTMTVSGSLPDGLGMYFNLWAVLGRAIFQNVIFAYLFGPALLGFALTFPHPKNFIQRRPWMLIIPFLLGGIVPALLFIQPSLAVIGFELTLGMILASIAALIHSSLTMRDAISRAQMRWAAGGVVLGLLLFTLNFVTYDGTGILREVLLAVAAFGLPVMGISLTVAILRYRLYDIDVIIRKTLVYALLTGLLSLLYFGGVALLSAVGGQSSPVVIVLTTLLIAALFNPLRRRLQAIIDRRFYRQKYDAEKLLAEFASQARADNDLERLSAGLLDTVDEALQPQFTHLWTTRRLGVPNDTKN